GAAYWLARRAGQRVLGLEQFTLGHSLGGSQDYSRIIRLAGYGEELARLTPYTYETWGEVERESGLQIVTRSGGVYWEPDDAPAGSTDYMQESVAAMDALGIPYERLSADAFRARFPQFRIKDHYEVIYQKDTGLVNPQRGNAAHQQLARAHGATILENMPVESIRPDGAGVKVVAGGQTFTGRKLIITAGAWVQRLLTEFGLDLRLTVTQEQVTYYRTPNLRDFMPDRFPVFLVPTPIGGIYGFPIHGEVATKAAIDLAGQVVTPETRTFEPDKAIEEYQEAWLKEHIPGFLGPKLYSKTCLYTMPRDRTFIIDTLPDLPQVLLCVGAGHAFKFASLFGQILSELAIDGQTPHDISSLTLNRPAITDPNYDSPVLNQIAVRGY
ncbi:MAG: N-methyl-L-tryptophan oxidase, partial [Anaerolineales bacterium]|nr:N-methyl-L-tryptophan oxidase [Anaerolineales bacterium]